MSIIVTGNPHKWPHTALVEASGSQVKGGRHCTRVGAHTAIEEEQREKNGNCM